MIVNDELPYAYELQYHTTSCRCCGASDHHAAFFAVHRVRERQGNSKRLVPCARPEQVHDGEEHHERHEDECADAQLKGVAPLVRQLSLP
jgi:hypothetical protein